MPFRDRELDALSDQLGACLGQIDGQIERLLAAAVQNVDAETTLDDQTAELHDLIDSVLATVRLDDDRADLDRVVTHCIERTIQNAGVPLVVRRKLAGNLAPAACSTGELLHAVQRALNLAAEFAGSGGEVAVQTSGDDTEARLEITAESTGTPQANVRERALTLQAFVANWQGRCQVETGDGHRLDLHFELPVSVETDQGSEG